MLTVCFLSFIFSELSFPYSPIFLLDFEKSDYCLPLKVLPNTFKPLRLCIKNICNLYFLPPLPPRQALRQRPWAKLTKTPHPSKLVLPIFLLTGLLHNPWPAIGWVTSSAILPHQLHEGRNISLFSICYISRAWHSAWHIAGSLIPVKWMNTSLYISLFPGYKWFGIWVPRYGPLFSSCM